MPRILEERSLEDYEPSAKEVEEYAEWLGMDIQEDADLLWIARKGLKTPLSKPWKACESGEGEIFYFNPETGESRWDHPCDEHLQRLFASEKAKRRAEPDKEASKVQLPPLDNTSEAPATEDEKPAPDAKSEKACGKEETSPPTPKSSDILAAELQGEAAPSDQLSLWSQIDEGAEGGLQASKGAWHQRSGASLELSSLTAVLERSPASGLCDEAKNMVEELNFLQRAPSPGSPACPKARKPLEEVEALRLELAAAKSHCDRLHVPAAGSKSAPAAQRRSAPTEDCTAASEMRNSPLGSTLKLPAHWVSAHAQEADHTRDSAARQEALRVELQALTHRVQAVEEAAASKAGLREHSPATPAGKARAGLPELQDLRAALVDTERLLHEARQALQRECEAHDATRAALREGQGEAAKAQSQLRNKEADAERARAEIGRLEAALARRDDENHQLQLQLQCREGEVSRLRGHMAAQARQGEAAFQQRRQQALQEQEQELLARERFVAARERLLGKARGVAGAECLRATMSEAGLLPGRARPAKPAVESLSSPEAACPVSGESMETGQSSEARCLFESPSPGSGGSQGAGEEAPRREDGFAAFFGARSVKEMAAVLHVRRRELRNEHAELEEERRQWRHEARKARRAASESRTAGPGAEARSALDERAAALNRAIGEYRTLEQILVSQQHRQSSPQGGKGEQGRQPGREAKKEAGRSRSATRRREGSCPASPCTVRASAGGA